MARYENDDITRLDLPEPNRLSVKKYNMSGEPAGDDELVCAKITTNKETYVVNHYVLCAGGQMFNPRLRDARYETRNNWKLVRVRQQTFDLYKLFLKTKRVAYLYQAEREL